MAHPASVSDEDVFAKLDALDASGAAITPNRVRTELAGGNPGRYRDLIERWRMARSLEKDAPADPGATATALFDEIARTIEIGLYLDMGFLDPAFRTRVARNLAGRVGGSLIRRGLASEQALQAAPPDPLAFYAERGAGTAAGSLGYSTSPLPAGPSAGA